MATATDVEIRLLGRFVVRRDGAEVPAGAFGGRLARRLVRVLAMDRGAPRTRDALVEVLWPTHLPADPAANLAVQISRARRALGDGLIQTVGPGYALTRDPRCHVDAEDFQRAVREARDLEDRDPARALAILRDALRLWRGPPLAEDADEAWARDWQGLLHRTRQHALESAARAAIACGASEAAVEYGHQAVGAEPLREAGHVVLAEALAAAGDRAGALAVHDHLRERLADELGLDPSPAASAARLALLQSDTPASPAPAPVSSVTPATWHRIDAWPFVGRERDHAAVLAAIGDGAATVIDGRSGSGKSALVQAVVRVLDRPVVSARASLPERDEPFAVAAALLRDVAALDVALLDGLGPRARPALADVVPDLVDPGPDAPTTTADTRRAIVMQAAVTALRAAASRGAVVVVDDLQWVDASSAALLARVVGDDGAPPLLVAVRGEEVADGPVRDLLAHLQGPHTRVVRLGAMTAAEIGRVLADPALVQVVVDETDRSPFELREVVRRLDHDGVVRPTTDGRWTAAVDDAVARARRAAREGRRALIRARVAAQPVATQDVLAALALFDREVGARAVGTVVGRDEDTVLDDLERLIQADLARFTGTGWRVAHDHTARPVVAGLADAQRVRLHTAIALRAADDPAERARHLAAAAHEDTAAAFAEAARHRLDRHATAEAADLAEDGLQVAATGSGPAVELLRVRAETRFQRGDPAGARTDLRAALAAAEDASVRARIRSRLAMLTLGADDPELSRSLVELALVDSASDPAARADVLAVAAIVDLNGGDARRGEARAVEARALYEQLGHAEGVADVLDAQAMAGFLAGQVTDAIGQFDVVARTYEETGNLLRVITPRSTRGHALVFADRAGDGLADIDRALALTRTLGHVEGEAYARWHRAEALLALGRPEAAGEEADRALALAESLRHRGWTVVAHRAVGLAAAARGDRDAAIASLRTGLARADNLDLFASWCASSLARLLIRAGALDQAGPLVDRALATGPALAGYEARLAEAELALAAASPDAPVRRDAALARARSGGHLASARVLATLGDGPHDG